MKKFLVSMLLAWLVASVAASTGLVSQGSSPEIVFIDFPKQIPADGSKVSGFVGFKDPDGDLSRAEFTVVQAKDFQPFTLDLRMLRGTKEGVFEFTLSTTTAQQVVLRVTLVDEAGNRSQPQEFSFEAIGTGAILQVSPTSLSFSSEVGRNPPSQTIQITNAGSGTLSWSASADQPWIGLNPSSGMAPSIVTVSINATTLTAGSYSGRITIAAPGSSEQPNSRNSEYDTQTSDSTSGVRGESNTAGVSRPGGGKQPRGSNPHSAQYRGAGTDMGSPGEQSLAPCKPR
jgi:hypothetical protein